MDLPKPYNSYNIFFILERAFLLEERKNYSGPPPGSVRPDPTGYEDVELPPLPPRYSHLQQILPIDWFCPGIKRRHNNKGHGGRFITIT